MLTVKEIKKITKKVCQFNNIPIAYLFGSYAKGLATANSDVDLLIVDPNPERSLGEFYALQETFSNEFGVPCHLITLEHIEPNTRFEKEFYDNAILMHTYSVEEYHRSAQYLISSLWEN